MMMALSLDAFLEERPMKSVLPKSTSKHINQSCDNMKRQ